MSHSDRCATIERITKETSVEVSWNLDGSGVHSIRSGLPFFDHMLAQLSKHSNTDIDLKIDGDIHVDSHHSVEDAGIVLGEAFSRALGDKSGIRRFASLSLPLDEALVAVAIDLSGRPYLEVHVDFGDNNPLGSPSFEPQLTEEFFRAFVQNAGISAHIDLIRGKNTHHIVEAIFKCFARCIKDAIIVEGTSLPSTKGSL